MSPRRLLLAAVLAALILAVALSGVAERLSLEEFSRHQAMIRQWSSDHPVAAVGAYVLAYGLLIGLSLPAGFIMSLSGGVLFGAWFGGAAAVVGFTLGSLLAYLAARSALGAPLRRWLDGRPGLAARIMAGFDRDALPYIISLRLFPFAPPQLVNIAAGLARAPVRSFVLGTVIGAAPSSVVYAGVGAGMIDVLADGGTPDVSVVLSPAVLWPLVGLAALALLPIAARRWRARQAGLTGGQ